MVDKEVVITYKRKRFSSQSDLAYATKALKSSLKSPIKISPRRSCPKVELDAYEEKLNKDSLQCFKCGNFDVDENLLRCGCCSETHHFHCMDAPQKSASWRKWQCPICHRRNDSKDSQHDDVEESREGKKSKRTEDLGPMELRSHKVLLSIKLAGGHSRKANNSAADSFLEKATDSIQLNCTDDRSGPISVPMDCTDDQSDPSSKFTDLDDIKPNPTCLNSSSEIKYSSGHPEDSIMKLNADKTDERLKEKCRTPLITFSRRVKKKREGTGNLAERNLTPEEKQRSRTTLRSHAAESNCIYEGSSSICSFKDQSASAVVLLEETEMPNTEKDAGLKSTPVGGFGETKIAGDGTGELLSHSLKEVNINNQNPVPSRHATDVPYSEDQSKALMEAAATDFVKNSILIQDDEQSDSAKFGSPVKEESGNELPIVNSEETNLPYDELVEGEHPCELVAPYTSPCMNNIESSKPLTDVMAENLLESQSSSTPSCPAVADEETDGRSKELEWLEDLGRVLRVKKDRATCSFVVQAGINCGQESSGKDSPVVPTKSSLQSTCDQGLSSEHMNGMTPFQGNVFLTKFGDPGFEKQRHAETSIRSSLCSDFLGMSRHLNRGGHVDSIKDVQSVLLPSSSGVKDNVHVPNRHLSWNPSNENSFFLRRKQMVDNVITGTRMLNERQCSAMNMFRRYMSKWTEEELDFLWIGVRRHGISNWNAMLRDPKLHFLESRIAEDLAMQWDVEQKKLLNGTLLHPPRFHRADSSSSLIMDNASLVRSTSADQYGGSVWSHACSEFPMLASETKLSLGDVYHQKRNLFHSSGVGIANSLRSESSSTNFLLNSSSVGPVFAKSGIRLQMPISCENTRYDWGPSTLQQTGEKSIHEHQSAGPSAATTSSNLPHWLQEAVNSPSPQPRGSSMLPVVSNTAHSEGLLNDDLRLKMPLTYNAEPSAPPKDPRGRGILKRKNVGSGNKIVGPRRNEVSSSLNESQKVDVLPLLGMASEKATTTDVTITREKKSLSNQNRESDLVVIVSDASSEETISDDQNIRSS